MPPRKTAATAAAEPPDDKRPPEQGQEEYEVRRQALLAKLPPKEERPKSLVGKLALVTSLVGTIRKTGENKYHNYKYAKESDLVEAIRPLLAELGVWLHMTLSWDESGNFRWVGHERVKIGEEATVPSLTILMIAFHFIDGETGETTPVQIFPGYGDDTSDKGAYKALTGAEKYYLMKTFLVATGDDPEGDTRADERAAARDAVAVTVSRPRGQAAAHGGRQAQATQPQTRVLGETLRAKGIVTTVDAITALEAVLETSVPIGDAEDLSGALGAFIQGLDAETTAKAIAGIKALPDKDIAAPPDPADFKDEMGRTPPPESPDDGDELPAEV
jgi:hypothetical protein